MADQIRGEFDLIDSIQRRVSDHPLVRIGIGDDAAVLHPLGDLELIVTTDMLLDGRHFILKDAGPKRVGYKSLGVNLSDLAAMAAQPVAAFISVALPKEAAYQIGNDLLEGMLPLADRFGVGIAGGDTNVWEGPLVVNIAVLGTPVGPEPVRRDGARPGDRILVTGPLGGSILGRHLQPEPRILEAIQLVRATRPTAMLDISDGLASDLGQILKASGGLGATLNSEAIPIHPDAERLSRQDGVSAIEHAMTDGEDFELCFTVDSEEAATLLSNPPERLTLSAIGWITEEPGIRFEHPDGSVQPLRLSGFDHFRR